MQVIKRNGTFERFDSNKIQESIKLAAEAIGADVPTVNISFNKETVSVEEILDKIVETLYREGYSEVADSFSSHRERRRRERGVMKKLLRSISDISIKSAKDVDLKRENANIDGDTAMGQMLRFGSETAKSFYLTNVIKPEYAEAHLNGDIHIHDLDFYAMTTTCCQIDLESLLARGFDTGHGHIRSPKSIRTAGNLACIAIQSNQNDQHGGQSIPNFDRALAHYVNLSVQREYKDKIIEYLQELGIDHTFYEGYIKKNGLADVVYREKPVFENNQKREDERDFLMKLTGFGLETVYDWQQSAYTIALEKADKETYQAMEGVVHNLNTMNSRAGAQVPFSSINFGTDTSPAARCVARNLILAQEAGLGCGETPIFPILIYRLKDGINTKEGDPNYDIFKLAIRCSSKRMFPNFSFQDAPFNLQYYDSERPETEITYMGALDGSATVHAAKPNYGGLKPKFADLELSRLWEIAVKRATEKGLPLVTEGKSQYYDFSKDPFVFVRDSSAERELYAAVQRVYRTFDLGNWWEVNFSSGDRYFCTEDHPFPVVGKGRTEAKDLVEGDVVEGCKFNPDYASGCTVVSAKFVGKRNIPSYDIMSGTGRFDVDNKFNSFNCRTRVIGNVHDPDREISYSRGNLSFTSINLPRLAIEYVAKNGKADTPVKFQRFLDDYVRPKFELVKNQLLERFKLQCSRTVKNFPFLMKQGVWLDSEKLGKNEHLAEVLKHGTLSIGFIGLAETLKMLIGEHHGESELAQYYGLQIVKYMRKQTDAFAMEQKLNFTLLATPAEGLCLKGNTLVQTTHGPVPIRKIKPGDYVLSYNEKLHKTQVDRVLRAGKTSDRRKVCKVTFTNGQFIICTPDHPFAKRAVYRDDRYKITTVDGFSEYIIWRQANELLPGDRIKSCILRTKNRGYWVQKTEDRYIHKIVYTDLYGELPPNMQIHHLDENKNNNDPSNLIAMTSLEHKKFHGSKSLKKWRYNHTNIKGTKNPFFNKKYTKDLVEKRNETNRGRRVLAAIDPEKLLAEFREGDSYDNLAAKYNVSVTAYKSHISQLLDDEYLAQTELNHTVAKVEFLERPTTVYDITTEKNHNFYVGGLDGVLVHNSGRFVRMDKKKYGEIEGVTDKEFYTNSFHVPVEYEISAFKKIEKEAPYHALTNAGHISYVELDGDASQNLEAFEKLVLQMKKSGMGYGAINHPIDSDPECGFYGVINGDVCPKCGRKETKDKPFERIRRITGYLVGTLDRFNNAKKAEESMRVKHD